MEDETLKKTRTPSRVLVINEVQAVMAPHMDAITNLIIRANTVGVEGNLADLVGEHLTAIRNGVEALREGHPKHDKDDTTVVLPKRGGGTHFVGVTGDEKVVYLRRRDDVYYTDDEHASPAETLAHIYGPFNTEDGARYAAAHGTYDQRPQVM